jgi:hypothetical protein
VNGLVKTIGGRRIPDSLESFESLRYGRVIDQALFVCPNWKPHKQGKGEEVMILQHTRYIKAARRLAAAVVVLAVGTIGSAQAADNLTLTAGSPGGGYFKAAAALAEYIKMEIPDISTTVIPGGGWANIERIDPKAGTADIAVLENALASMAFEGTGPDCQPCLFGDQSPRVSAIVQKRAS